MLRIPRIALLHPDERDAAAITALFQRHNYSIRPVLSADEIASLVVEESAPFDCIVVPMRMQGGASPIPACLQIKANSELTSTPILGISLTKDKAALQSLYGAGADVVFLGAPDPEHLFVQIGALARQARAFEEQHQLRASSGALRSSLISALDTAREGIIIFDGAREMLCANFAAQFLLAANTDSEVARQCAQFLPALDRVEATDRTSLSIITDTLPISRIDGQVFTGSIKAKRLLSGDGSAPLGFALSITDASEIAQLSEALIQSERAHALSLTAAASWKLFFPTSIPRSPLAVMELKMDQEPRETRVGPALDFVTELLDVIMSPSVQLSVDIDQDAKVGVSYTDLVQMLGFLVLGGGGYSGISARTNIRVRGTEDPSTVSILVAIELTHPPTAVPGDPLSDLLCGNLARGSAPTADGAKIGYGLHAAQKIGDKYGVTVEYQKPSESLIRLRVKLPRVA